jgi:hypothetical protein
MEKENKEWQKPELIVLVRNKQEEAVLVACKSTAVGGAGFWWTGCWGPGTGCDTVCSEQTAS